MIVSTHRMARANARYGRIVTGIYTALTCCCSPVCGRGVGLRARANHHGIAPNTTLGFRSQRPWRRCTGGYAAAHRIRIRRRGRRPPSPRWCCLIVAVAYIRHANLLWIFLAPPSAEPRSHLRHDRRPAGECCRHASRPLPHMAIRRHPPRHFPR